MRGSRVLVLLAVLALVSVVMLVAVGGGNAKPQRALGGGGKTHYQHHPVADMNTTTQLYPPVGSSPASKALAITSLTIDNPSDSSISVGIVDESPCGGGGLVLSRIRIPALDTIHLEYSGEPLIAKGELSRGPDPGWCLTIDPAGSGENVIATIVGYTFKP
jgi:hypothetical protein